MSTWAVYSIQGRTKDGQTVAANNKDAHRWFIRWRVDGVLRKRTLPSKGYARTFHEHLTRAGLMGWAADERGWPLDPAVTAVPAPSPASVIAPAPVATFASYCDDVWWPIMSPGFGDKNMLGHRNNMRLAMELLVYPERDPRCDGRHGAVPGNSILLDDLRPDDLRLALVARRQRNGRTAAANDRRLATALANGETDIRLAREVASPATVRAFYVTLSMIVNAAVRSGHTTGDPLNGVATLAPVVRGTGMTNRLVPSIDEIFDLADAIATLGPVVNGRPAGDRYRSLILAAGTLGARPGELVAHRPEWFQFGAPSVVRFEETEAAVYDAETGLAGRRSRELKHREAGDFREIPALPEVAEALRIHFERGHHQPDRTWTSPTGRGHLDWGNLNQTFWRPALQKVYAGTEKAALLTMSPKTLRKAAITYWLESGISIYLAAEWAGHSTDVAKTYYAGRSATTYSNEMALLTNARGPGRP